jgi:hypothetical protein
VVDARTNTDAFFGTPDDDWRDADDEMTQSNAHGNSVGRLLMGAAVRMPSAVMVAQVCALCESTKVQHLLFVCC